MTPEQLEMTILATLKQALDDLKAVLCDPEGAVCITGSDGDRTVTQQALANFSAAINQIEKAEPAAFAVQLAEDGSLSWNTIWEERWAANDHLNSLIQEGLHTGECHVLPLYTSPPDAQEEIEALREMLATAHQTSDLNSNALEETQAEIERIRQVCRNVYEVWAGSEGLPMPETAPEAYLRQLVIQMADEAKEGLE